MAEDRQPKMRAMIMADDEDDRRAALGELLPLQQEDFEGLFEAMAGLPVTIRLLDPPLHEFALKLREVGVRNAQGFSAADLLHGHIAAVQTDTAGVVAGMAGPSLPSLRECAAALRARGARTVVISDDPALRESADVAVPVQSATESLAAIPMTVVGQWLTLQDAITRGLDPDRPPGLTKIVRTV